MKKVLVFASLLVFFVSLNGCGSSPESLVQDQIKAMNDMADALEKNAPEAKLTELKNRADEIGKKLEKLNLSEDEKKKLFEKHKDEITKAGQRLMTAMMGKAMQGLGPQLQGMPGMPTMPGMPAMPTMPAMPRTSSKS
jgi:peptidoglycan hydrolase CwlO-like protein